MSILLPIEARADSINFGFVAVAGIIILVPLTIFVVLVEAIFISIGLKIPYRKALSPVFVANMVSLAAGIPVKIFNSWMYWQILPQAFAPYFRAYPWVMLLGTSIYFTVSLVAEYIVIAVWCRNRKIQIVSRRLAMAVLLGNIATYVVLAPLHYIATKPIHDVKEFTDDSRWACVPPTTLLYVNSKGILCAIGTDGNNSRVLVSDRVRDYQYLPDQNICLYRNADNNLCIFRESDSKPIVCWKTSKQFMMDQVACSPDGKIVAYIRHVGEPKPYELVLFAVDSGKDINAGLYLDGDFSDAEIAWSDKNSSLYVKAGNKIDMITIGDRMTASITKCEQNKCCLSRVFGRFGSSRWYRGNDWGVRFPNDKGEGQEAFSMPGLGSHLRIVVEGKAIVIRDNPGLLKLGNRWFNDVCFLDNGKELVFDERHDIYLFDINQRKAGRIAEGSNFILLNDKYARKIGDMKN